MSWTTCSLNDVLVKTENINPANEPNRVFQYVDVSSVSKELLKITEPQSILGLEAPSRARKLIKKDDVLFATIRPTLMRVALVPSELNGEVCSTGYFVFRSNGKVLQKFIFYYLLRNKFVEIMEKIQTGASYPAVTDKQVKEQIISFPSLDIQKKIIQKLDAIFAEIHKATAAAEANARNAEALFKSYLNRVFEIEGREWSPIKVSKLGKVKSGGTPSSSVREYWGDEIEWYSSGELNDLYTSQSISRVTSEGLKNSNAKVFPENSLLIGMYDTAAMKMSLLSSPAAFNQAIVGIEPSDKFNTIFLYYAFLHIKPYVLSLRRGVRQKNLSLAKIKELEIKLPSIDIQESVCRRLNDFSKTVDFIFLIQFKKISHLNDLKNSILKEAFSAELVQE